MDKMDKLNATSLKIYKLVSQQPGITTTEVQALVGLSGSATRDQLRRMRLAGHLDAEWIGGPEVTAQLAYSLGAKPLTRDDVGPKPQAPSKWTPAQWQHSLEMLPELHALGTWTSPGQYAPGAKRSRLNSLIRHTWAPRGMVEFVGLKNSARVWRVVDDWRERMGPPPEEIAPPPAKMWDTLVSLSPRDTVIVQMLDTTTGEQLRSQVVSADTGETLFSLIPEVGHE